VAVAAVDSIKEKIDWGKDQFFMWRCATARNQYTI